MLKMLLIFLQLKKNVFDICISIICNYFLILRLFTYWGFHFKNAIFAIKVKNQMSSKKSQKNLKNQEKYSKNNGENPSSNRWTVKKLWAKDYLKITPGPKRHFLSSLLPIIFESSISLSWGFHHCS